MGKELIHVGEPWDISDLKLDPVNPRKGELADLCESLDELGQHRAAVVHQDTKEVIIGNHMVKAAKMIGWTKIGVAWVNDDEATAARRKLADNRISEKGGWDKEKFTLTLEIAGGDAPGLDDDFIRKHTLSADIGSLQSPDSLTEAPLPLVPIANERYEIVAILCTTDGEWSGIQTILKLRKHKSYKDSSTGIPRVIFASDLIELWNASPIRVELPEDGDDE